ncbi:hypothetical protein ABIB17_002372 [Arthrobacter sp. UYEF6]
MDRDGDHLVAFNNEAGRSAAEELPAGVSLHTVTCYGNLHEATATVGHSAGDGAGSPLAEASVATELGLPGSNCCPSKAPATPASALNWLAS